MLQDIFSKLSLVALFASFHVFLLSSQPLLFFSNLTKLSEACLHGGVFGKVGASVRLRHILRLRSSLKTDRAVCKNSPTRYITK